MAIKIKNWKLAILTVLFFSLFTALGYWQISRAHQKEALLAAYALRSEQVPLSNKALTPHNDLRFYRANLVGYFDNRYTFLLDNKIHNGNIGYEIYTLFHANSIAQPLLVDRGFVSIGRGRQYLPFIQNIRGLVHVDGILNLPPTYVSFGKMHEKGNELTWPLRVEYINLKEINNLLPNLPPFFPYVLILSSNHPAAYTVNWQVVTMSPERHRGYAIQWFALALTLLILFVALNWQSPHHK